MISAQTRRVCREGKPLHTFPDHALPPLAHMDVDVEIDVADAGLLAAMRAAVVPWSRARLGIPDMGKPQAAPLRQPAAALPRELPGQHDFLAAPVAADDMRAELAPPPVVAAHDLPLGEDRRA